MITDAHDRINQGLEAVSEDKFVNLIKLQISRRFDLSPQALNEISLNDVEFNPDLKFQDVSHDLGLAEKISRPDHAACIGFWVYPGRELILYIISGNLPETLVIPDQGWRLRQDITVH